MDLIAYRRRGHNELDDPLMTQPKMYERIKETITVANKYRDKLMVFKILVN